MSSPRTIFLRVERVGLSSVVVSSEGIGCVDVEGVGEGDDAFVVDGPCSSFLRFFGRGSEDVWKKDQ